MYKHFHLTFWWTREENNQQHVIASKRLMTITWVNFDHADLYISRPVFRYQQNRHRSAKSLCMLFSKSNRWIHTSLRRASHPEHGNAPILMRDTVSILGRILTTFNPMVTVISMSGSDNVQSSRLPMTRQFLKESAPHLPSFLYAFIEAHWCSTMLSKTITKSEKGGNHLVHPILTWLWTRSGWFTSEWSKYNWWSWSWCHSFLIVGDFQISPLCACRFFYHELFVVDLGSDLPGAAIGIWSFTYLKFLLVPKTAAICWKYQYLTAIESTTSSTNTDYCSSNLGSYAPDVLLTAVGSDIDLRCHCSFTDLGKLWSLKRVSDVDRFTSSVTDGNANVINTQSSDIELWDVDFWQWTVGFQWQKWLDFCSICSSVINLWGIKIDIGKKLNKGQHQEILISIEDHYIGNHCISFRLTLD